MTIGASTVSAYDLNFTCDAKRCARCNKSFIRMQVPHRRLADGAVIDPNEYCTLCETQMAREAWERKREQEERELRARQNQSERARQVEIDRMQMECLRKEAFDSARLAHAVAKLSRARHRGKSPCGAYRCRCKIDPILFPERAKPHWHIGGHSDRKL